MDVGAGNGAGSIRHTASNATGTHAHTHAGAHAHAEQHLKNHAGGGIHDDRRDQTVRLPSFDLMHTRLSTPTHTHTHTHTRRRAGTRAHTKSFFACDVRPLRSLALWFNCTHSGRAVRVRRHGPG